MSVSFNTKENNGYTTITTSIENHLNDKKIKFCCLFDLFLIKKIDLGTMLNGLNIAERLSKVIVYIRRSSIENSLVSGQCKIGH